MHEQRIPTGAELADDVATAARNVGVSRAFAYREIAAGRLRSFKAGKLRRVTRDAQREYVVARERETNAQ
jgi:excisionase family DNA binding protein